MNSISDPGLIRQMAAQLDQGRDIIFQVAMRDWGGEVKPLRALLNIFVPLLPGSRWRLIFRPERLGVENLKSYCAITDKLAGYDRLPDGSMRFSAPGVPGSPDFPGDAHAVLLLFDHPEDLKHWYDLTVSRLITRHSEVNATWFVNPMFLKISDHPGNLSPMGKKTDNAILFPGSRVMIAANVVDSLDIEIAFAGFRGLAPLVDKLIIAPRVITNPVRNAMITTAAAGMKVGWLSGLEKEKGQAGKQPGGDNHGCEVLIVDTYGDLPRLYHNACITYLGGGFDHRKQGFDPMESLFAGVPVILGPFFKYNRIAVEALCPSGWVYVLKTAKHAVADFIQHGSQMIKQPPRIQPFREFLRRHEHDPVQVMTEVLAGIVNI